MSPKWCYSPSYLTEMKYYVVQEVHRWHNLVTHIETGLVCSYFVKWNWTNKIIYNPTILWLNTLSGNSVWYTCTWVTSVLWIRCRSELHAGIRNMSLGCNIIQTELGSPAGLNISHYVTVVELVVLHCLYLNFSGWKISRRIPTFTLAVQHQNVLVKTSPN